MDLLADVLAVSGVHGTVAARVEAGDDWGWWAADNPGAMFHAVTAGTAWLGLPGEPPRQLMPGDVVLLPSGIDHSMAADARRVPRDQADASTLSSDGGVYRIGSGPVRSHVLCAHYHHDPAVSTQVLRSLPEVVHIRADNGGGCLDDTVRLIARELAHPQLATAVVLDRLVDVLLVQLLRAWLATGAAAHGEQSWLAVLGDPLVSDALARLHDDPARPWTTELLAAEVAVSRATLSRRFLAVAGESPAAYLTRWRMDLAALRLRDTSDSLEAIAASIGYTSVYAFGRAFRRARDQSPGRYRAASRQPGRARTAA